MGYLTYRFLIIPIVLLFSFAALSFAEQPAAVQTVATSADAICPLLIGSPVPDLTVKTVAGESFDLKAAIRSKPTVLIFYRGGW